MSSADMEGTDIRKAAIEVVLALHENKIPIVLAQSVFKEAMELIERNTIPYSPKAFSISPPFCESTPKPIIAVGKCSEIK